jgi:hypothetical protein
MNPVFHGTLEVDHKRGVIYFHSSDPYVVDRFGAVTLLRICHLPTIPNNRPLDITHMVGCDWHEPKEVGNV